MKKIILGIALAAALTADAQPGRLRVWLAPDYPVFIYPSDPCWDFAIGFGGGTIFLDQCPYWGPSYYPAWYARWGGRNWNRGGGRGGNWRGGRGGHAGGWSRGGAGGARVGGGAARVSGARGGAARVSGARSGGGHGGGHSGGHR